MEVRGFWGHRSFVHQLAHCTCCSNVWLIELALFGLLALSWLLHTYWGSTHSAGATVGIDQSRLAPDAHSAELLDAEALEVEQAPSSER